MNTKKVVGISAAVVVVGMAVLVGYKAFFPPTPEPELDTLCRYISHSATDAQCTAAIAPEGFPVGNIVSVPEPPTPTVPLAPVLRSFAQTCWLDPEKAAEITKQLARPAVDMTLPGFTADISQELKSGASITLAEADNLKIIAGSRSNQLKSISVSPRHVQAYQLDQALLEALLHKPEIREDCLTRLLGNGTRLVVSIIVANGLNYTVNSTDDHHLDLDAAIKTGYINVDGGPQANSGGKVTTTLSEESPRVIGAVFGDKMLVDELQSMVRKGNLITSSGKSQVKVTTRLFEDIPWLSVKPEIQANQAPSGSFSFNTESMTPFTNVPFEAVIPGTGWGQYSFGPQRQQLARRQKFVASMVQPPRADGSATAVATNSTPAPAQGTPTATIDFATHATLDPGLFDLRGSTVDSGIPPGRSISPVKFVESSEGTFRVLKRLDGPESLVVTITRRGQPSSTGNAGELALGDIVIQVQDALHKNIAPEFTRPLNEITNQGMSVKASVSEAGAYSVDVFRRTDFVAKTPTAVDSGIKVEVELVPEPVSAQPEHERHG